MASDGALVLSFRFTNPIMHKHVPGQALDLSQSNLPDATVTISLLQSKIERAIIVFSPGPPNHIESYADQTIRVWRDQDNKLLRIIFDKILTDPEKVKDWVELIQRSNDGKILGVVSATVLTLWSHIEQLLDVSKTKYWLTPAFGAPEIWLCHGFKVEEDPSLVG